jgi:hypothetical protein
MGNIGIVSTAIVEAAMQAHWDLCTISVTYPAILTQKLQIKDFPGVLLRKSRGMLYISLELPWI